MTGSQMHVIVSRREERRGSTLITVQAPLLHLWSEAAAAPATLLARFLPPTVAALLPMDLLQASAAPPIRMDVSEDRLRNGFASSFDCICW